MTLSFPFDTVILDSLVTVVVVLFRFDGVVALSVDCMRLVVRCCKLAYAKHVLALLSRRIKYYYHVVIIFS